MVRHSFYLQQAIPLPFLEFCQLKRIHTWHYTQHTLSLVRFYALLHALMFSMCIFAPFYVCHVFFAKFKKENFSHFLQFYVFNAFLSIYLLARKDVSF